MKVVDIILVGYGRVGKAFLQLIHEKRDLCRSQYGLDIQLKAVVRSDRILFSQRGLDVDGRLEENLHWKSGISLSDIFEIGGQGVLVDCISSNLKTGEPGLSYFYQALERGWNIVTADKVPLVVDFHNLKQRAKENSLALKFSGATAAALPTVDIALFSLAGTEITRIEGILNGTTNYILTKMQEGMEYEKALREAQSKGIAEPDPSFDVEGWDTASKILLISNAVVDTNFALEDIKVEGITNIPSHFKDQAQKPGVSLKLLGKLSKVKDDFKIEVALTVINNSHPLFGVDGAEKGISFTTDTMDRVTVIGGKSDPRGAGAALLKDIINIYR